MGVLLILLGLLVAGLVVDVAVENQIATAATQQLTFLGMTVDVSAPMLAVLSFALGALAVLLIAAGIGRFRRARRMTMRDRLNRLEEENARLATQQNLPNVVRIPEPEMQPAPATQAAPAGSAPPPSTPEPPTSQPGSQPGPQPGSQEESPTTRW
jgi:hypothetical protein